MLSSKPSSESSAPPTKPSTGPGDTSGGSEPQDGPPDGPQDGPPDGPPDVDYSEILEKTDYQKRPKKRRRLFGDEEDLQYEPLRAPSNRELNRLIRVFVAQVVQRNAEYCARVRTIPQHLPSGIANPEWLDARNGRITGSKAIKASVKTQTVIQRRRFDSEMIHCANFPTFVRTLVEYGNAMEKEADAALRYVFERNAEYKEVEYNYPGLCINSAEPHLAMSPDGVWTVDDLACLIEYKCRAYWCLNCDFKVTDDGVLMKKKKDGPPVWEIIGSFFPPTSEDKWMLQDTELFPKKMRWPIPPKYLAQLRHGVYTIDHVKIKKVVFCAWICYTGEYQEIGMDRYVTPHGTVQITVIDVADLAEGCAVQKARVNSYYNKKYLPNIVLKQEGYHGLYPPP